MCALFSTIPPVALGKLLASELRPRPSLVWKISALLPTQEHCFSNCFLSPLHLQFPSLSHSHPHTKKLNLKIKPSLDLTFPPSYQSTSLPSSTENIYKTLTKHGGSFPILPIPSWMQSYQAFLPSIPWKRFHKHPEPICISHTLCPPHALHHHHLTFHTFTCLSVA